MQTHDTTRLSITHIIYMHKRHIFNAKALLTLAACALILAVNAISKNGKLLGYDPKGKAQATSAAANDTITVGEDGSMVINTAPLGKDIIGYAGTVPVKITVTDDTVRQISVMDNEETGSFLTRAEKVTAQWTGKSLEEAAKAEVDAVSGATYTSEAIITNVKRGLQYAMLHRPAAEKPDNRPLSAKDIAAIVVALCAAILPLFVKSHVYRNTQLALNVAVLGFWGGHFLSYSSMTGYMANGVLTAPAIVTLVMFVTAFAYPLAGKNAHYCSHLCPFGSLQQLCGKLRTRREGELRLLAKWRPATAVTRRLHKALTWEAEGKRLSIGPKTLKRLHTMRLVLWVTLTLLIWTGAWPQWTDYEPFAAFLYESAPWVAVCIAVTTAVTSLFVTRPYCRFACPTGSLLNLQQTWARQHAHTNEPPHHGTR